MVMLVPIVKWWQDWQVCPNGWDYLILSYIADSNGFIVYFLYVQYLIDNYCNLIVHDKSPLILKPHWF